MYVGLFVRDKCERSVKNQDSKMNQCNLRLASAKLARSNLQKKPHVEHMIGSWRVTLGCQVCKCFARRAILWNTRETFCLTKIKLLYQILYPHYKYPHYPWIVRSAFQRKNPRKCTWELEIVIPTIIYTFLCGFP